MPVQVGGGLRTMPRPSTTRSQAGAARVVLGTAALRDVDFLDEALAAHGDRVVVSVDARDGQLADLGLDRADRDPGRVGDRAPRAAAGCAGSCTRASSATGCSAAPTSTGARRVAERGRGAASSTRAAISSLDDLRALAALRQVNLAGVIVGKALYEERFTVAEAPGGARLRARLMHYKRVIPCLDVDGGRVVKGVGFVDLRDAGDPVELAAATTPPAPTSSCSSTSPPPRTSATTVVELARRAADEVFIPFTIGGGIRSVADAQAVLDAGADKVSVNSAALARPELIDELAATFGAQCVVLAIDAKARPDGGWEAYVAGGRTPTGPRRGRVGARGRRARRGGDPAHQHGPRRHQRRLRPRADLRRRRRGRRAGDRLGRRGRARAPRRGAAAPAPTPCCARRSSTTATTPSPRSRSTSARAGVAVRLE